MLKYLYIYIYILFIVSYIVSKRNFTLLLDAVLMGHDNWVYSVKWKRIPSDSCKHKLKLKLNYI